MLETRVLNQFPVGELYEIREWPDGWLRLCENLLGTRWLERYDPEKREWLHVEPEEPELVIEPEPN